jgi:hypothetical protein
MRFAPSIVARDQTALIVCSGLDLVQLVPLFVERKTPSPVPAKIFVPPTVFRVVTNDVTIPLVSPKLAIFQFAPLLVERNTPLPYVPAKIFVPMTAREKIVVLVKPELTAVQFVPLLVERKTPLYVPAKRSVPLTARL